MPNKFVWKDAYLAINGTVVSNLANSLQVEDTADEIDFTGFSSAGYKEIGQGLKDATISPTFFSDFGTPGANSGINNILQPLYSSGGTFLVEIRPTSAAVSSSNPRGSMIARLFSYSGMGGAVGEGAAFDAAFRNAGTAGLTWGTT